MSSLNSNPPRHLKSNLARQDLDMTGEKNSGDTIPVLFVLDFNVANATDDPNDPFNSGRIAVGALHDGKLKTLIEHGRRPDGIEVLQENGGMIFWTQMCHPEQNDGVVQRQVDAISHLCTIQI